jgi:hypothetical protein
MKIKEKIFILIAALVTLVLALFLSPFASGFPDGLEKVAGKLGFADKAASFVNFKFIMPNYSFPGIKSAFWKTSLAGFFGVLIIFAVFALILWITVLVNKNKKIEKK